jgi:hypothetical protein
VSVSVLTVVVNVVGMVSTSVNVVDAVMVSMTVFVNSVVMTSVLVTVAVCVVERVVVVIDVTEVGSESVVLAGIVTTEGVEVVVVTIVLVVMPSRLLQKGTTTEFAFRTVTMSSTSSQIRLGVDVLLLEVVTEDRVV